MAMLAHPTIENRFSVVMHGLDDHKADFEPVVSVMRQLGVDSQVWETAASYAEALTTCTKQDILISDNYIEGLDNLNSIGMNNVPTDSGTNAGLMLLTKYCDNKEVQANLKIILTQYQMDRNTKRYIKRRQNKGEKIYVFSKQKEDDLLEINKLVKNHYSSCYMEFVKEKFDFVSSVLTGWQLSQSEVNTLFGIVSDSPAPVENLKSKFSSVDLEDRCDLIYRIKLNLSVVYGGDDLEQDVLSE